MRRIPSNIGVIYVLKNRAMKGFYKIGITDKEIRTYITELNQTSDISQPFELVYSYPIGNHIEAEKAFHQAFDKQRSKRTRGFFKINPDDIKPLIEFISKSTLALTNVRNKEKNLKIPKLQHKKEIIIPKQQNKKEINSRVSKKQNTTLLNRKFVERIKTDIYESRPQISQNNYRKQEELSLSQGNPHRISKSRFIAPTFIKK